MTSIRIIWLTLCLFWAFAEIRLSHKSRLDKGTLMQSEQSSQKRIWFSVLMGLVLAFWFNHLAWLPIPIAYVPRQLIALLLFAAGLSIRYRAIQQLGLFFTTDVTIQQQHRLITEGLYRRVRHPTYSGMLLALAAAGIAMGDFIALLTLTALSFCGIHSRIAIEEQMLEQAFGKAYREYCGRSWKLLPWLF